MPYFRVRTTDGSVRTQQALRMRTDADMLYLEDRKAGTWRPVLERRLEGSNSSSAASPSTTVWKTESLPTTATRQ